MVPPDLLTGTTMVSSGLRADIWASSTSASTLSRIHSHGPWWFGRSCCGKKAFWSARVPRAEPPMPSTTMCLNRRSRGVRALRRAVRLLRKGRLRNGSLPEATSPMRRALQLSSCGSRSLSACGRVGAVVSSRPAHACFQSKVCIPSPEKRRPRAAFSGSGIFGTGGQRYCPMRTLRTRARASISTSSATA